MSVLLNNFWLKISAVALGLLIWLHVATEKTYTHQLMLPVTEITLMDSLTLSSDPPDSLMVSVSATGKYLLRKKWRTGGVRISAVQYQPGRYQLALSTDNVSLMDNSAALTLEEILSPNQIWLNIDQQSRLKLPVVGNFDIEASDGFAIGQPITIEPDSVTLTGPQSVLRTFSNIKTGSKQLRGLRDNITLHLPLEIPDRYGLSVRPDSVKVFLEVVPVKTRVFEGVPIRIFNAPPDSVLNPDPGMLRIELTGPPDEIDMLENAAITASVDYRAITNGGVAPIVIDCPPIFRVKSSSAQYCRIRAAANANPGN